MAETLRVSNLHCNGEIRRISTTTRPPGRISHAARRISLLQLIGLQTDQLQFDHHTSKILFRNAA
jgi:hypothetical protein